VPSFTFELDAWSMSVNNKRSCCAKRASQFADCLNPHLPARGWPRGPSRPRNQRAAAAGEENGFASQWWRARKLC